MNNILNKKKNYIITIFNVFTLVFLDQISKILATYNLKNKNAFTIIPNVFEFIYLENYGAAFGSMQGKRWLFLIFTIILCICIIYEFIKMPHNNIYKIIYIMLFSGAIGNAIDRLLFGYVRDFIYFKLINFPVFNLADCYVTISVVIIILIVFKNKKEKNNYYLFKELEKILIKKEGENN